MSVADTSLAELCEPAATADPLQDLEAASDDAKDDESEHDPFGFGGTGDSEDLAAEADGHKTNDGESDSTHNQDQAEQLGPRVGKRASAGDHHRKRKRRRRETSDPDSDGRLVGHAPLEECQTLGLHHFLETLFAALPANGIQQQDPKGGADGSGQYIEREIGVVTNRERDYQQIVAKGEKEEGRVRDTEQ